MTNRWIAATYGILVSCALALILLIVTAPDGISLLIVVAVGILTWLVTLYWLDRH